MATSSPSPSSSPSPPPAPLPQPPPASLSQSHSASPSLSPNQKPFLLPQLETKPLSPPKKSPPFSWTHQETLALIKAYQEKWYSLKRGQLKAFQWEEVSVTVAARCGFDEPSKTATQCRHKIEKLRKRYRSELQKPYPNSWQYFEPMDQMESGPTPLNARPIAAVKSSPNNTNTNSHNGNSFSHGYGSLYSNSADYYNNNTGGGGGGGGVSDESDEDWNAGYGVDAMAKSRLKSTNNIAGANVNSGIKSENRMGMGMGMGRQMSMGFSGSSSSRNARPMQNVKPKQYYVDNDSDEDDDDSGNDVEDEQQVQAEDGEDSGRTNLAMEITGFAETFMRMENKKIEMMQKSERYRMEMEKKRMEMILEAQRKIVDTIGRAFGAHKKAKMDEEL